MVRPSDKIEDKEEGKLAEDLEIEDEDEGKSDEDLEVPTLASILVDPQCLEELTISRHILLPLLPIPPLPLPLPMLPSLQARSAISSASSFPSSRFPLPPPPSPPHIPGIGPSPLHPRSALRHLPLPSSSFPLHTTSTWPLPPELPPRRSIMKQKLTLPSALKKENKSTGDGHQLKPSDIRSLVQEYEGSTK